jgi:hypothetical protein
VRLRLLDGHIPVERWYRQGARPQWEVIMGIGLVFGGSGVSFYIVE